MKKFILLTLLMLPYIITYGYTSSYELKVGDVKYLSLPAAPNNGYINSAAFGCDNANITITEQNEKGAIISVNKYFKGTAVITAFYQYVWWDYWTNTYQVNSSNAYYRITCYDQKVSLNTTSVSLYPNETYQLKISGGSNNYTPIWTSSNSKVAEVDSKGIIKAKSTGSTNITCDPIVGSSVYCSVTVKSVPPKSVEISPASASLEEGESFQLKAILTPSEAKDNLTWNSENTAIATVTSKGLVKALKQGTVNIKVHTTNGLSATCKVNVAPLPTEVQLPENIVILEGYHKTLIPTLLPENSKSSYTWSSSNTSIATVSVKGKIIAKKAGSANIKVTTKNGKSAVCKVTVTKTPDNLSRENLNPKINRINTLINNTKKQY